MPSYEDVVAGFSMPLQDAMEIAIKNLPKFARKVYVCPDVSGSMSSPASFIRTFF